MQKNEAFKSPKFIHKCRLIAKVHKYVQTCTKNHGQQKVYNCLPTALLMLVTTFSGSPFANNYLVHNSLVIHVVTKPSQSLGSSKSYISKNVIQEISSSAPPNHL